MGIPTAITCRPRGAGRHAMQAVRSHREKPNMRCRPLRIVRHVAAGRSRIWQPAVNMRPLVASERAPYRAAAMADLDATFRDIHYRQPDKLGRRS